MIDNNAQTLTHIEVNKGSDLEFKVEIIDPSLAIENLEVKDNSQIFNKNEQGLYVIKNITSNHVITIEDNKKKEFDINFTYDKSKFEIYDKAGNKIDKDNVSVEYGNDFEFKINILDPSLSPDGLEVTEDTTKLTSDEQGLYVIKNITSNHGITIEDKKQRLVLNIDNQQITGSIAVGKTYKDEITRLLESNSLDIKELNSCGWFSDNKYMNCFDENKIIQKGENYTLYTKRVTQEMLDKLTFKYDYENSIYEVEAKDTTITGDLVLPCAYNDGINGKHNITLNDFFAFNECKNLHNIVISVSITSIGEWTFSGCSSLTSIGIPNSVTSIGLSAFEDCSSLTNIKLPNSVTSIGLSAFEGCSSLTNIELPYSVTAIEDLTFWDCSSLTNIELPYSVTSIGEGAFFNCSSLINIEIPNSVTSIGKNTFWGCSSLTSIKISNSLTLINDGTFNDCNSLTSIVIPDSVISIGKNTFWGCSSLTSIKISNSLTLINEGTFKDCVSLTSIIIPDRVTSIGVEAFSNCSSLISVEISNSVISIGEDAFFNCSSLTSIEIPNSVTSIEKDSFYNCSSLASILVDNGNTVYHSKNNCLIETDTKKLILGCKNSIIPNNGSVTSIEGYAFWGCSSLTKIEIPNSITSIGDMAFRNCSSLTDLEIPASVTLLGRVVFEGCSSLSSLIVDKGNTIYHSKNNCLIETNTKKLILGCKNSIIPNDDSITTIGEEAFEACSSLTSIVIPNNVTTIQGGAFFNCTSLTKIIIPNSVTTIGDYVFSYISSDAEIYCEASSKPDGWDDNWTDVDSTHIHWGYNP